MRARKVGRSGFPNVSHVMWPTPQRHCPDCGKLRHSKGSHHTVFRTVFGTIPVESPRFTHCPCQAHDTESFSPLAVLLPEHTTPELLYLETKWAALASYGMSVKMFEDVLPMDEPLATGHDSQSCVEAGGALGG